MLDEFPARFERYWLAGMRKKLGLRTDEAGDAELIQALLDWMQKIPGRLHQHVPRPVVGGAAGRRPVSGSGLPGLVRPLAGAARSGRTAAAADALMRAVNPAVIPRNHRVEEALSAAEERDDLSVLHRLLAALASPYEARPELAEYREPPADECGYRTFCGT